MTLTTRDVHARIEAEIVTAMLALGAPPMTLRLAGSRNVHGALSALFECLKAPSELRAIIDCYGCTLDDAEILTMLEAYNRGERAGRADGAGSAVRAKPA